MPADSQHIKEEGVLLPLCRLTKTENSWKKKFCMSKNGGVSGALTGANVADLRAQIAALTIGVSEMRRAAAEFGDTTVLAFLRLVQKDAEQAACVFYKN